MKGLAIALAFLLTLGADAAAQVPNPDCTSRPEGAAPLFLGVTTQIFGITCPAPEGNFVSTAHVIRVELTVPGLAFEASSAPSAGSFTADADHGILRRRRRALAEISNGKVLSPFRNNRRTASNRIPSPRASSSPPTGCVS